MYFQTNIFYKCGCFLLCINLFNYIIRELDFINVMTYDFHGKWEKKTGHNCPLYPHRKDKGDQKYLNLVCTVANTHI